MSNRLYLLLGRVGDIVNFLPVLHHESQSGTRPLLMTAKDYAPILEGVSYVEPVIFDGGVHEVARAFDQASKLSGTVKCVQVNGHPIDIQKYSFQPGGAVHATTDSFAKESWKLAGHFDLWKEQPPLVFDRRNREREMALRQSVLGNDKRKLILVATQGVTSPFPSGDLLMELLRLRFRRFYNIVNLSAIKAERFYDLLTFYERARCLVSIDTAALHLAAASPKLPVCALVNDKPTLWTGSAWRANHIFHCRYSDWASRAVEMLAAIDNIDAHGSYFYAPTPQPRIFHAFNGYSGKTPLFDTWNSAYDTGHWVMCRAEPGMFGRNNVRFPWTNSDAASEAAKSSEIPFLKDVIRMAALRAEMSDIICLTRSDIGFNENLTDAILANAPCYAHRATTPAEISPPNLSTEISASKNLSYHPATDLFAFTKQFWTEHSRDLPDLLLGPDALWHRLMREWIVTCGGKPIPFAVFRAPAKPSVVPTLGKAHNEGLIHQWFSSRAPLAIIPKVSVQVPTFQVNRRAISPFGYNPSLIERENGYLLSYRWHSAGSFSTTLAIAELDDQFNVRASKPVELTGAKSFEDMKFFRHKGEIWCSYVETEFPAKLTCVVRYGQLVKTEKGWTVSGQWQIQYGKNDGTALEKNWSFFSSGDRLFCIYQTVPEQVVLEIDGYKRIAEYKSAFPHWKWGEVKGGVMAGLYQGKLLRFFHSSLDNEPPPNVRRYYVGAALMEPEPPFTTIALSSEPIVRGSERCDLTQSEAAQCQHYKKQVVFPGGVVKRGDEWLLAVGINDAQCSILKLNEAALKL